MAEKLLVQVQGSKNDPSYDKQSVVVDRGPIKEQISFPEYFNRNGIGVLRETLVTSCHGNTEDALKYARQIQKLADDGHKVAVIAQGGLYFALPSIIAANAPTVPVISIPLKASYGGLDAFLAPQLPSGTAAIGGTTINGYERAAKTAKEILANEFEGVYLFNTPASLEKSLEKFNIPVIGKANDSLKSGLVIGCMDCEHEETLNEILWTASGAVGIIVHGEHTEPENATELMHNFPLGNSVYVRGEENAAFLAAKIVSAYNEKARNVLKGLAKKKAGSYEKRDITLDSFVGGK